ncbi:MAG: UvrD-helicase domain-containing protein, partial [Planctomycetia bacterium]|nr:UvrD-helicase domain-containing protein [Planctomycetia bacterium]
MQASDQSPLDLSALTAPQREAVEHVDGPLLILAGPGSGKTRVVTHRIANLLSLGVPAHQILALTFTNKAADEMRERVHTLAPGARVTLGTFHRFCARLLRQYAPHVGLAENFTIYDTDDSLKAFKQALEQAKVELARYQPEQVRHRISWLKNHLLGVANFEPRPGHALDSIVARVLPLYQAKLLSSNAVDFDDLLLHVAQLLRDQPEVRRELDARYRYVLVDEYQDTNLAQYAIARGLSIDFPNLAVTGDPDQSIYGWRGANLGNILDFERDYPQVRVVRLEQNYRSTKCILRVADALISNNRRRKAKELFTDNDEGRPVALVRYPNNRDEAAAIAERIATEVTAGRRRPRDFAIFYRTNALSRSLELALHDRGIPFQLIKGVEFFQRKEIKDVMAYLHLVNNPRDDVALARIINTPARGIGASTVKRLAAHAADRRFSLLDAAREAGLVPDLSKGAAVKVAKFVSLFDRLSLAAAAPLEELMGQVLMESGYRQVLVEAAAAESDSEEAQDRLANIEELLTVAREFDEQHPGGGGLEEFLEQNALVNDIDDWTTENDKVVLMTMHSAKGLEFPVVFIVAVEEGLLPHERSRDHPDKLEEERRLLFVGITRAREELELSYAKSRDFRGQRRPTIPSQFLMELPRDEMEVAEPGWSFEEFSDAGDDVFAADAHDGTLDGPLDGSLDGPLDGPTAAEVEVFNELSELVRDS